MFHLLLPISWGSCCFWDCGGAVSVPAITNETIPLFLFLFSPTVVLFTSLCSQLFDRMCYLQPPATVPLSLSSHHLQLNPTAACHGEAGRKWWCCCLKWEWGEKNRHWSTNVDVSVLASQVFCCVPGFSVQLPFSCLTVCRNKLQTLHC